MKQQSTDSTVLVALLGGLGALWFYDFWSRISWIESYFFVWSVVTIALITLGWVWENRTPASRRRKELLKRALEVPVSVRVPSEKAVRLGKEHELGFPVYLPDSIRSRHVHVLGATGSGKTESVILNFLKQDVNRKLGAIILDAKGDASFLAILRELVPEKHLRVFDLSNPQSLAFNPLEVGGPMEAAQRLFASLTWSEEYYKSKALSALQQLFESHHRKYSLNPTLAEIAGYLKNAATYGSNATEQDTPEDQIKKDFAELSGLRDQVLSLCNSHLKSLLSPPAGAGVQLSQASQGVVIYFRLQSLLSPKVVSSVGKLLINCLAYMAGSAHRETTVSAKTLVPVYLDEFASFACPEFADLISKARSAGYALHFSHQSVGDLADVSPGFLSQITDNSATKIVMRVNDPDTAEFFSRAFGTQLTRKVTQRVQNSQDITNAEIEGVGSMREAQQFRASPDLLKTLPIGQGAVLIAHGEDAPSGASSVLRIKFPPIQALGAPEKAEA